MVGGGVILFHLHGGPSALKQWQGRAIGTGVPWALILALFAPRSSPLHGAITQPVPWGSTSPCGNNLPIFPPLVAYTDALCMVLTQAEHPLHFPRALVHDEGPEKAL